MHTLANTLPWLRLQRLTAALSAMIIAGGISAATIIQDEDQQPAGTYSWNTTTVWNPDGAPAGGNDYFTLTGLGLRTPTGTNTFAGDSLTIVSGSTLIAKQNANITATLPNLILDGGTLSAGTPVGTTAFQTFSGNLEIRSDSELLISGSASRRIQYTGGSLSGAGNLTITGPAAPDYNNILFLNGITNGGHSGAFDITNSRLVTAGNNVIGDTSLVALHAARLDIRGNEVFGGLAGDSASSVIIDGTVRTLTLAPQNDATYAGSLGTFSGATPNITVSAASGKSQTLQSTSIKIGTLNVNAGTLNLDGAAGTISNLEVVGTGALTQNGTSSITVGAELRIGYTAGSGSYIANSGTLNVLNGQTEVARGGTGTLTIAGATANLRTLYIGVDNTGVLNMNGGALNIPAGGSDDMYVGFRSTGTLNHTAGTTTINGDLRVAESNSHAASSGTVNFDGGTLSAGRLLGARLEEGTSNFFMNGGTLNIAAEGWAGYAGTGTFTQTGGDASFGTFRVTETLSGEGATGVGTLNLNGGTFTTGGLEKGLGSASVSMNGGTLRASQSFTADTGIAFQGPGGGTFDTNGNNLTLSGALTGTGPITKLGTGKLTFSGANGSSGDIDIQAGNLTIANAGAAGSPGLVQVAAGATFDVTAVANYPVASVTISGEGDFKASSLNVSSGTLDLIDVTGTASTGTVVGTGVVTQSGTSTMTLSSQLRIGFTAGNGSYIANGGTLNVLSNTTEVATGGTGTLTVDGAIVNLRTTNIGVNSTGILNVSSGELHITESGVNQGLFIGVNGDGTLNYTGGTTTNNGDLRVSEKVNSTGTVHFDGGTFTSDRLVAARVIGTTSTITMSAGTVNFPSDAWLSYAGNGSFTQTGGDIAFGQFRMTNDASANGTLNLHGGTFTTSAWINGSGSRTFNMNGGTLRAGASFTEPTAITLNSPNGGTFDSNGNTLTVSGALTGSGPITKIGNGTVSLSGTNSNTGAIDIQAGTLKIANAGAVGGPGSVHIASGAIFDVSSVAGYSPAGATISGGGELKFSGPISFTGAALSPGNSPGTLTLNGGTVNGIGTYNWQLFNVGSTPGSDWDLIDITAGDYTIAASDVINITGLSALPNVVGLPAGLDIAVRGNQSGPFTILQTSGTINGLLSDITVNAGNLAQYGFFTLSIAGGNQLQLLFTSTVPEPGTWALLAALLALGIVLRRRLHRPCMVPSI